MCCVLALHAVVEVPGVWHAWGLTRCEDDKDGLESVLTPCCCPPGCPAWPPSYSWIALIYNICYALALFWMLLFYVGTEELLKV